jgi:hypothetical protein
MGGMDNGKMSKEMEEKRAEIKGTERERKHRDNRKIGQRR